jgi:hypothetical protein
MIRLTRRLLVGGIIGSTVFAPLAENAQAANDRKLLLSYFEGGRGAAAGLRFAVSDDGLTFRALHGGRVLLRPEVGEEKLMRDPFLLRGPRDSDPWHLLWTTAWNGVTLGHTTSDDLINWSPQHALPVMSSVPRTRNVWAPEMIWDSNARHYVIVWSSTVTGRFTETAGTSEDGYNHRLWYATTRDFVTISKPAVLWDPGFSVIDATFFAHSDKGLHLIIKDETLKPEKKHLRIALAASPLGPFIDLSPPFSPNWVEGPTAIRIGDWTYVYYDRYREASWGAMRSRDLKRWEDVTSLISFPQGARHGTVVEVPADALAGLDA